MLGCFGLCPNGHIYKFSKRTFQSLRESMGFARVCQRDVSSPFGEIWGKSSGTTLGARPLYRLLLPVVWAAASLTWQGNRLSIILRVGGKPCCDAVCRCRSALS